MMSRKTTPAHHIQPTYRAFLVFELWLACCANPAMHLDGHQLDCPEDGCGGKLNSMCWKRRWVCELDGSHSLHSFKKYECSTCGHSCQGIDPRILKSLPPHVRNLVDVHFFREFAVRSSVLDACRIASPQGVSFSLQARSIHELAAIQQLRRQMNYYSEHLANASYREENPSISFGPSPPPPKIPEMTIPHDMVKVSACQLIAALRRIHSDSMTVFGSIEQQYVTGDTWGYDATFKARKSVTGPERGGAWHSIMDLLSGKLVSRGGESDKMDYDLIKYALERSTELLGDKQTRIHMLYVDNEKQVGGQLRQKIPLLNVTGPSHLVSWRLPSQVKVTVVRTWADAAAVSYALVTGE